MCHPLGPMPWALANAEGLCKTSSPALAGALQKNVSQEQQLPQRSATPIDDMSLVQKLKSNQENFGVVAPMVLKVREKSQRIDIVSYTYCDVFTKDFKRGVCLEQHGLELKNITSQQKVRKCCELLKYRGNKTSIIAIFTHVLKTEQHRKKLSRKVLYVTTEDICSKITEVKKLQNCNVHRKTQMVRSCYMFWMLHLMTKCPLSL